MTKEEFDEEFVKHYNRLVRWGVKIQDFNLEGKDLVHMAYLRTYPKEGRKFDVDNFISVMNKNIKWAKYNFKNKSKNAGLDIQLYHLYHESIQPFYEEPYKERTEVLEDAIAKLSEEEKEIVRLCYEGYKTKEIAKAIGLSEFTVKDKKTKIKKKYEESRKNS